MTRLRPGGYEGRKEGIMEWRIRESRNGWHAEKGVMVKEHLCPWKPGYIMPAFVVYESVRFDTKRQAERYIKQKTGK